jgi:hypothetical protein
MVKKKGKAISVTGRESPYGCETSRLPHFLDDRLTDGGKVVSALRALHNNCDVLSSTRSGRPQGHNAAGWIDVLGNQTRDLQACSIVPQQNTLLGG